MAEQDDLLQAVLDNPDDDAPRLSYAEWCEQNGETARAELIRVQLDLATLGVNGGFHGYELFRREQELLAQGVATWTHPASEFVTSYKFHRGFIEQVALSAAAFIDDAGALYDLAPIRYVKLSGARPALGELFQSPHLENLRALSLSENGLTDNDMPYLATSPHLGKLWWLDLSYNNIELKGARTLAASTSLPAVTFLSLKNNPCDPAESFGMEGTTIQDASLPEEGKALEAEFGHIPWLHINTNSLLEYPPDPLQVR